MAIRWCRAFSLKEISRKIPKTYQNENIAFLPKFKFKPDESGFVQKLQLEAFNLCLGLKVSLKNPTVQKNHG